MDLADRFKFDVPVVQAGMGGGLSGSALAGAVARAGALGTLGLAAPEMLRTAIGEVREIAPGRAVAVNLLMPYVHRAHVDVCVADRVDAVVLAFGHPDAELVGRLREAGVFVLRMVSTEDEARQAVGWGVDGLIAQGREAGGHLVGTTPAREFLPKALAVAGGRPVWLAGGIASAADTRAALAAGAVGAVAGTRFLMTHESGAHPEYLRRVSRAERTIETTLFGLSWPVRHRVLPNAATRRWCRDDGSPKALPAALNAHSAPLARATGNAVGLAAKLQRAALPLFSPVAPLAGMSPATVDRAALYAGQTALRIDRVTSVQQAVADLTPVS